MRLPVCVYMSVCSNWDEMNYVYSETKAYITCMIYTHVHIHTHKMSIYTDFVQPRIEYKNCFYSPLINQEHSVSWVIPHIWYFFSVLYHQKNLITFSLENKLFIGNYSSAFWFSFFRYFPLYYVNTGKPFFHYVDFYMDYCI